MNPDFGSPITPADAARYRRFDFSPETLANEAVRRQQVARGRPFVRAALHERWITRRRTTSGRRTRLDRVTEDPLETSQSLLNLGNASLVDVSSDSIYGASANVFVGSSQNSLFWDDSALVTPTFFSTPRTNSTNFSVPVPTPLADTMANDGEAEPPAPVVRTKELADCLIKVRIGILRHEDDMDGLDPDQLDTPCLRAYLEEAMEAKKGLQTGLVPLQVAADPGLPAIADRAERAKRGLVLFIRNAQKALATRKREQDAALLAQQLRDHEARMAEQANETQRIQAEAAQRLAPPPPAPAIEPPPTTRP